MSNDRLKRIAPVTHTYIIRRDSTEHSKTLAVAEVFRLLGPQDFGRPECRRWLRWPWHRNAFHAGYLLGLTALMARMSKGQIVITVEDRP